ncbi:UNC93-like protein [Portunus trituberculatus]|uniref:UNC93-like protein n=1 Tax=Portunus trituberculatus TaxID=210409 RepID=UPI001E1D13F4|nr:UNC93-like protein [Portunus trituberculatus]XP_045110415.1 UNC93-like protein [Portunus trituberculatus]XP_045110416.1 UNC93-like protein [Portunus trituberculatus]
MADHDKKQGLHNPAFSNDDGKLQTEPSANFKKVDNGFGMTEVVIQEKKEGDPAQQRAIMKNVLIISLAFTFLFTAFNSMANLQSSINQANGTVSLTIIYVALVVSCCFLPSLFIKFFKSKYTMALCMGAYSTYIAAQFYPTLSSLLPTGILLGIAAAPLWSAKCTYLTKVGNKYADLTGQNEEVIVTRYFGIFFLFFQSTQVWGNLISSTVLSSGGEELNKTEEELNQCGYNFCLTEETEKNSTGNGTDDIIPDWQRYTMASIYLVFALLSSVIIMLFVDPLSRFCGDIAETEEKSSIQLLIATFNHMRHPYQLLIIPLTIWSGVEQGFFQSDFTAAYVSCGLGVHMVGYVMICYGVCDALCSISFSPLVKLVGRVPVFTVGAVINFGVIITLIKWRPHPDDTAIFFVLAGLWGVSDAIWQTQINAFYGVIFPGKAEAAFSNYRLWESIGFIISFATSSLICIKAKIIILFVFIISGMIGYFVIEVTEKRGGLKKDNNGNVITIDELIKGTPHEH